MQLLDIRGNKKTKSSLYVRMGITFSPGSSSWWNIKIRKQLFFALVFTWQFRWGQFASTELLESFPFQSTNILTGFDWTLIDQSNCQNSDFREYFVPSILSSKTVHIYHIYHCIYHIFILFIYPYIITFLMEGRGWAIIKKNLEKIYIYIIY